MVASEGFVYPIRIIPIDKFIIHQAPHLDEIAGVVLVALYGEDAFPGVRKAFELRNFVFGEFLGTQEHAERDRILPLGTGDGCLFNEHVKDGDRMPGECATTLVVKYLRRDKLPVLRRLVSEVLECDTQDGVNPTRLAELVKVDNRRKDGKAKEIFSWAAPAIMHIIVRESQILRRVKLEKPDGEKTLIDYFRAWLYETETANGPMEKRVRDSLFTRLHQSMREKDCFVTELAHIVESMARTGASEEYIADWLHYAFTAMQIDQTAFWAEVDVQVKTPPVLVKALLNGTEGYIFLSVVESDSLNAPKAARHCRNLLQKEIPEERKIRGVTLVGTSSGNMQVYSDKEIRWRIVRAGRRNYAGILSVAVRITRSLELKKSDDSWIPPFDELGGEGEGPDGLWYYFKGMLLNGTTTHNKPPSQIKLAEMTELLRNSFHPRLFSAWHECKFGFVPHLW